MPHFSDALTELVNDWQWAEVGDTVDDIIGSCVDSVETWYSDMLIGTVQMFLTATIPDGWLLLDGTTYNKTDYPELWSRLAATLTTPTQFTLPDMDETFPMGEALAASVGATGGSNTHVLTEAEMPSHSHLYTPPALTINAETPTTPVPTAGIGTATQTGSAGSDNAHNNQPSYLRVFFAVFAGRT